jgi:hypothetical protein
MDGLVRIDALFGHVEIVTTRRWDGEKLILGGFSRHYDRNGALERETEPIDNIAMDYTGMSRAEIFAACGDAPNQQSAPKRGFISRLIARCSK